MSRYISALDVAAFDKAVKIAYAANPGLRNTVRVKSNVVGASYRFQKMEQGLATKKVPQADVILMNIDYDTVQCTLEDWHAAELSDIFDQQRINFRERNELATVSAAAVRRREDQIIIEAMQAGAGHQVDLGLSTEQPLTTEKFRQAKRLLDSGNIPKTDRHFLCHVDGLYDLLSDADADTFDKNAIKALVKGEIAVWLGFNIQDISDMAEGGLPLIDVGGDDAHANFAYQRDNIGLATGKNMMTEIDFLPMKTSYLVNTIFSAGAVTIEGDGVIRVLSLKVT